MTTRKKSTLSSVFIAFLSLAAGASTTSRAQDDQAPYQQADAEDMFVRIDRSGFANISQFLTNKFSKGIRNQALPDSSMPLGRRLSVDIRGLRASVDIDQITLQPTEGGLQIDALVRRVDVDIGRVEVNKHHSSFAVICDGTRISLGGNRPLELHAQIGLELDAAGGVQAQAREFSLPIDKMQYESQGPAYCIGPFFGHHDRLTTYAVRKALSHADIVLEEVVRQKFEEMLPDISRQINSQSLGQPLAVTILGYGNAPSARVQVQAKPEALQIDPSGLKISLSAAVQSVQQVNEHAVEVAPPARNYYYLATLGLNQQVIDQTLRGLIGDGSKEFEVTPSLDPQLADFLKVKALAGFWPELNNVNAEDENARLFASLTEPPVLTPNPADGTLQVAVSNARLRFKIKLQGQWQDYFIVKANLGLVVKTELTLGKLTITARDPKLTLTGDWASDYQPQDATFDAEGLTETFMTFLQVAIAKYTPAQFQLAGPQFKDPSTGITFDKMGQEGNFLTMGIVGYTAVANQRLAPVARPLPAVRLAPYRNLAPARY